jgi:hypothetical protein
MVVYTGYPLVSRQKITNLEKIMKSTMRLFLLVALFCGTVLADGEMGGGGLAAPGEMGGGGVAAPGEMGGGGVAVNSTEKPGSIQTTDEIVVVFTKYIFKIFV